MKFKTKLVSMIALFAVFFSFMIVGVLAVKQTNFNVGGNINFRATGINAVISQGTLNNALWVDESEAENKLKEIILNTYKTGEEIETEFQSWQGLNLMFNENGDDATITFSITNTSEHEEYFAVNASVNQGTSTNATVDITPKMLELAPGKSQDYTITFSITDPEINASILSFKIDLDMELKTLLAAEEYSTLTFTYDNTNYTASVKANTDNKPTGDLVLPSFVKYNNEVYKVTSITDATSSSRGAFYNCTGLTSITIPNSITSIGKFAFYNCGGLTSMNYFGDINSWVSISFGSETSNPTYYTKSLVINGETVINTVIDKATSINAYAFRDCATLKKVTIGDQVTSIGSYAFYNCIGLTSVTIGNSVTSIGSYAFYSCTGLSSMNYLGDINEWVSISFSNSDSNPIYYTNNLTINGEIVTNAIIDTALKISDYALCDCKSLTNITIGSQITSIGYLSLASTGIENIKFLEGVSNIGNNAFAACVNLVEVNIPDSLTSMGDFVFINCSSLSKLTIGSGITKIPTYAFYKCSALTDVSIGRNVKSIESRGFAGCSKLENLFIPESVTSIGSLAFDGCFKLKTVFINSGSLAARLSGSAETICGRLLFYATNICVKTDIVSSLNSYVTTNYPNVTVYTEGEYAGYTLYSK